MKSFTCFLFAALCSPALPDDLSSIAAADNIFAKDNLVAWCIVPFDSSKRNPQQRAKMLKRLGLQKVAYDWRQEHVATFEEEILAYKEHDLEFFAFWDVHESMFALFEKHKITPQIWKMMPQPTGATQNEKIRNAAKSILPLVKRTKQLGCKLGIYNHGGWSGEPANMASVVKWLRENDDAHHVGIVYNFHHGHDHIEQFQIHINSMLPYLFCVNLNGMNEKAQPKIVRLSEGRYEIDMMQIVKNSKYNGPIGILDHRSDADTEKVLQGNLNGMKTILKKMSDATALSTYEND